MALFGTASALIILVAIVTAGQDLEMSVTRDLNADFEWSMSPDRELFCNASSTAYFSGSWWYCGEENCNHCHMWPDNVFTCNSNGHPDNVTLLTTYCATYNEDTGSVEAGSCTYNEGNIHSTMSNAHIYTSLPRNVSELNEFMCGELFNRTGTLCGGCKDGYYPLVYSFDMNCIECPNGKSNWWKFLMVAFLPLTIFFYVIFFCRVNITSSALFGFVWYCQMICDPNMAKVLLVTTTNRKNVQMVMRVVGLFFEVWNLDFFRSLDLGICLHGIDTLLVLVLDLAIGFYPLLLMVLTYFVIELHNKGFPLFVFIWKPFGRLSRVIDANFSSKTSLIDAFVAFFLLTNVKFITISVSLLVPVTIFHINAKSCQNDTLRLFYDATVPYFGSRHLPYAILAISVFTVFVLLPTLLLILYPFRWFQRLLSLFPFRWYILHTFMDSFYGCYKDGTQPGTRDCRWFASLFFLVRTLFYIIVPFIPSLMVFPYASIALLIFSIILINIQPYKEAVRHYSTINTIFILLLAIVYTSAVGYNESDEEKQNYTLFFLLTTVSAGTIPLLYASAIIIHWVYTHNRFGLKLLIQKMKAKTHGYEVLS